MHNRRARPTLRVLQEDLTSEWGSAQPRRALAAGNFGELHPLSELPHPIVTKAVDSFGASAADDNYVGPIASATRLRLLEIKNSQWRGGVWEDPEAGVCWLVVAGLAKGGHQDRDDFYKMIERENESGDPTSWLPTEQDQRLLKQETTARIRTEWELQTQRLVLDALRVIHAGGTRRIEITHPVPEKGTFAHLDLTVAAVREAVYEADEVELEIVPADRYAGSALLWQLTIRVLISINHPSRTGTASTTRTRTSVSPALGRRELTSSTHSSLPSNWRCPNQGRPVTTPTDTSPVEPSAATPSVRYVAPTSCRHRITGQCQNARPARICWPSSPTEKWTLGIDQDWRLEPPSFAIAAASDMPQEVVECTQHRDVLARQHAIGSVQVTTAGMPPRRQVSLSPDRAADPSFNVGV